MATPYQYKVKSPKAARVKEIHVADGSNVFKGTLLLSLPSEEEELIVAQLQRSLDENAAKLAEVQGSRVSEKLAHLDRIAAIAQQVVPLGHSNQAATEDEITVGASRYVKLIYGRKIVLSHRLKEIQSSAEAYVYRKNVADTIAVLSALTRLYNAEIAYVRSYIDRLHIKAPFHGVVRLNVFAGATVDLGHHLLSIERL